MPTKALSEGTHGGIDLLGRNKHLDPDEIERNEPKRFRPTDQVTTVLAELLGDIGVGITNPQFTISNRDKGLRDTDIEFDRLFPQVRVLVKFYTQRIDTNAGQKQDQQMLADIKFHTDYAAAHNYTLLNCIGGKVEQSDLQRIKMEVSARRKGQKHVA